MARLDAVFATAAVLFVLSISVLLIPPAASNDLKPKPAEFINRCKREMGLECGNAINVYIFGRGAPYSDDCCNILVETGRECHDAVVTKHLLGKPREYIDMIFKKSDGVWEHCLRVLKYRKRHGRRL